MADASTSSRRNRFKVKRVDTAYNAADDDGDDSERTGLGDEAIEMDERNSNCGDGEVDRAASPTALLSHNTYATINEQTKYGKSLRHFTREALPRLDNYRNILSIQAGHRPTLEELHNATIQDKVNYCLIHGDSALLSAIYEPLHLTILYFFSPSLI